MWNVLLRLSVFVEILFYTVCWATGTAFDLGKTCSTNQRFTFGKSILVQRTMLVQKKPNVIVKWIVEIILG